VACEADQVCNGVCEEAQGLLKLTVPFAVSGDSHRIADKFVGTYDLTDTTVIIRAFAPGATGGEFHAYVVDTTQTGGAVLTTSLTDLSGGWKDVKLEVNASTVPLPTAVYQVTVEIRTGNSSTWATPTVVYIDRIRALNGQFDHTFSSDIGGIIGSQVMNVPGSTKEWVATVQQGGEGGAGGGPSGGVGGGGS
jgi:hypothetical protein